MCGTPENPGIPDTPDRLTRLHPIADLDEDATRQHVADERGTSRSRDRRSRGYRRNESPSLRSASADGALPMPKGGMSFRASTTSRRRR